MKIISFLMNATDFRSQKLFEYIEKEYKDLFNLEMLEIKEDLSQKIAVADGIIILSGEKNQENALALQDALKNKPILVMSSSEYSPMSSESQLELRQLLEAPDIGAYTFPGNEFFLGKVIDELSHAEKVQNKEIISLKNAFKKYICFIELVKEFEGVQTEAIEQEDLYANGSIETTIEDLDKEADDWLEQAAEKVDAVDGDTYVKLDRGLLTVNQLDYFLNSMPMELTFMDSNNQFLYYNYHKPAKQMLASTQPHQVGSPIAALHPEGGHERVEMLIQQLRLGKTNLFQIHVPTHGPDKFVVHNYQAVTDKNGHYLGVNEYVIDLQPVVNWYLKQTNQELVGGPAVDAVSSATTNDTEEAEVDGVSSASIQH